MQPAHFHPRALQAIRSFPQTARRSLGEAIVELQKGVHLTMPLSRPMPSVAGGASEIRVKDASGIYRVFYVAKSARGVLVFHAFQKRGQKTPLREIETGRRRLKEMLA